MKKLIECAICDGTASLTFEKRERSFRKQEFTVFESFYKCSSCGEEFTTTESDEVSINQFYNQYREKYRIPTPEQLTMLKEEYGLNSKSFSTLLGFGVNQFSHYEKGELPNESNGNLLSLCIDPSEVIKILERRKEVFSENRYKKVFQKLTQLIHKNKRFDLKNKYFVQNEFPNKFNGYTIPSFDKFANMVIFFLSNAYFKTRLCKLLFYADFAYYKYYGKSISGMEYAAIKLGPVPEQFEIKFGLLAANNIITTELDITNDKENEKFVSQSEFKKDLFSVNELETLKLVVSHFQYKKTKKIILISHKEEGWKKNFQNKSLISYLDYAPLLKEI